MFVRQRSIIPHDRSVCRLLRVVNRFIAPLTKNVCFASCLPPKVFPLAITTAGFVNLLPVNMVMRQEPT